MTTQTNYYNYMVNASYQVNPQTIVAEMYGYMNTYSNYGFFGFSAGNGAACNNYDYFNILADGGSEYQLENNNDPGNNQVDIAGGSTTGYQLFSLWGNSGSSSAMINYAHQEDNSASFPTFTTGYVCLENSQAISQYAYYVRTRMQPPNDQWRKRSGRKPGKPGSNVLPRSSR